MFICYSSCLLRAPHCYGTTCDQPLNFFSHASGAVVSFPKIKHNLRRGGGRVRVCAKNTGCAMDTLQCYNLPAPQSFLFIGHILPHHIYPCMVWSSTILYYFWLSLHALPISYCCVICYCVLMLCVLNTPHRRNVWRLKCHSLRYYVIHFCKRIVKQTPNDKWQLDPASKLHNITR